uniref:uncharacterized protein LOC120327869 n=1 Tax=Styela clava TaxID=7725 RepID=UPI001939C16D|nr:uncharacterized protein LOC120327869 [Styela clava]
MARGSNIMLAIVLLQSAFAYIAMAIFISNSFYKMWFLQISQNISANDTISFYKDEVYRQWLAAVVFASFTFFINFYVLVVTLIYEWKVQKENREIMNRIRQKNRYSRMRKHIASDVMRYLIITFLILFVAVGCLDAVELRYSYDHEVDICRNLRYVKHFLVAICLLIPYLIYWLRQRQFYKSDLLKPICNKFMQVLSWLVLAFMIIGRSHPLLLLQTASAYIALVIFQFSLLFLFVYPLWKLRKNHNANARRLMKRIKRSSIATTITIFAMMVGPIISIIYNSYFHLIIFDSLVLEFVILVATICVIASFDEWKLRLFPFAHHVTLVQATITDRPHSHSYHNTTIFG